MLEVASGPVVPLASLDVVPKKIDDRRCDLEFSVDGGLRSAWVSVQAGQAQNHHAAAGAEVLRRWRMAPR